MTNHFDAIVIGAGLAGLVAATEMADRNKRVLLLDQEPRSSLGGQAYWSFGGLFLVDTPEQRRLGVRDSFALAWQDWQGTAGFDRKDEDAWSTKWAKAYVQWAATEKREWLHSLGIRFFPVVGWAERGGSTADGHGNSVPRFHITWGTGPGVLEPFIDKLHKYERNNQITYFPRHQVDELIVENRQVVGVRGSELVPSSVARGRETSRERVGDFDYRASAVVVASGGIGANFDLIRKNWPEWLGRAPKKMIAGVPAHVDGRMISIAERAGGRVVNRDRMWHYTEGIRNWYPIWKQHGIRILPGPSSMWFDATGRRFHPPNMPGFDTLSTLKAITNTGYDYSWFILTQKVIEREFTLSGSEQNPDLTGKSIKKVLKRALPGAPEAVQAFVDHGEDFLVATTVRELVDKMNALGEGPVLSAEHIHEQMAARDREIDHTFTKDAQIAAIRNARTFTGDRLIRVAKPHKMLDRDNGPLIAIKLHIVSRKTLGGLQTNLNGQVLHEDGEPVPGLYAAGEAAGFGGGGLHGYRALEGTFLGGCLFTGKVVGEAIANR
ncbi:FAD-binding dehydrogenase [Geomicrobium sp. JSM 1781026]|uniref:FAD-binding dehydrogenase n=1 Tax=Geomicrobium sp. JSM 1781026 TaxID=3344580 RepID=UPI0035C1B43C